MINILYVVSTLKRCGPSNQLSYIIKHLDRDRFNPIVLTLSNETEDSYKPFFTDVLKVEVNTLGLPRLKGLFLVKNEIYKFILKNKIHIVHSQGIRADGFMSKISIPTVSTLRNYPVYDYCMTYGKVKGWLMAKTHLKFLSKIDAPFACSESISKMLLDNLGYKINYIRNGVDLERFNNLNKTDLRNKLGLDLNCKVFISVGHLSSRKDPVTIIKAFKKANLDNSILLFLGDGNERDDCLNEIGSATNIKIIGKISNVHEYLGASDCFISASHAEGLPNTVMEAMACSLPCILSDIPPHQEIQKLNSSSSLLFSTKSINELTDSLIKLEKMDAIEMGEAARSIVEQHLNAKIMSDNYQEHYLELLENKC